MLKQIAVYLLNSLKWLVIIVMGSYSLVNLLFKHNKGNNIPYCVSYWKFESSVYMGH